MEITCPNCGVLKKIEYWDELDAGIATLLRHMKRNHPTTTKTPNKRMTGDERRTRIRRRFESGKIPPTSDFLDLKHRVKK